MAILCKTQLLVPVLTRGAFGYTISEGYLLELLFIKIMTYLS